MEGFNSILQILIDYGWAMSDKQPTDSQIKEFWERCGLRYEIDQDEYKVIFPDGEWYGFGHDADITPDWKGIEPPIDLNNLFRWAVPKLLEKLGTVKTFDLLTHWLRRLIFYGEDAPLYLYRLILEVFHKR